MMTPAPEDLELDLTLETATAVETTQGNGAETRRTHTLYPLEHKERNTRARIAYFLLALVSVVIAVSLVMVWTAPLAKEGEASRIDNLLEVLKQVLPALITLFGTVVGFYFGGSQASAKK